MNPNQSWVLFFGLLAALLLTTCLGSEAKANGAFRAHRQLHIHAAGDHDHPRDNPHMG